MHWKNITIATGRELVATQTDLVATGTEAVATQTKYVATGREAVATRCILYREYTHPLSCDRNSSSGTGLCPVATGSHPVANRSV